MDIHPTMKEHTFFLSIRRTSILKKVYLITKEVSKDTKKINVRLTIYLDHNLIKLETTKYSIRKSPINL